MRGEVTHMTGEHAKSGRIRVRSAARAAAFRSELSEHFHGDFPLFLNRWEEGFELREHDHAYIEIAYVAAGEGYHYAGDRVERTGKGCLYVLPVGTSHVFRPSGASKRVKLIVYNLCIRPEFAEELTGWMSRYGSGAGSAFALLTQAPGAYLALRDKRMELSGLFERMHREFTEKPDGFELLLIGTVLEAIARIDRIRQGEPLAQAGADAPRKSSLSSVLDYVERHFAEPLTVERLSARFGISARHLIRRFQETTGEGFSAYLRRKRVEHACRLLTETDHKIAYIAKSSGYRDAAHFGEVFRSLVGASPSEYRKSRRDAR